MSHLICSYKLDVIFRDRFKNVKKERLGGSLVRETRVIIKVGKVFASIAAVIMLIAGILILITAIQQAMMGAGKIAECGNISIYGLLGSEENTTVISNSVMIVGAILCFLEAAAASLVNLCLKKVLNDGEIFNQQNEKRIRNLGIVLTVVFAVVNMILALYVSYNDIIFKHEYADKLIKQLGSACMFSVGVGVVFIILSVFIKAGYEERNVSK